MSPLKTAFMQKLIFDILQESYSFHICKKRMFLGFFSYNFHIRLNAKTMKTIEQSIQVVAARSVRIRDDATQGLIVLK